MADVRRGDGPWPMDLVAEVVVDTSYACLPPCVMRLGAY